MTALKAFGVVALFNAAGALSTHHELLFGCICSLFGGLLLGSITSQVD